MTQRASFTEQSPKLVTRGLLAKNSREALWSATIPSPLWDQRKGWLILFSLGIVKLDAKSWLATIALIALASWIGFVLNVAWVRPTAGVGFISDLGGLDPETHSAYEVDLDLIHRFWPVHIVPPSWFRESQHGIAVLSWLDAEHEARRTVTLAGWCIIVAYASWRQFRPNQAIQPTASRRTASLSDD